MSGPHDSPQGDKHACPSWWALMLEWLGGVHRSPPEPAQPGPFRRGGLFYEEAAAAAAEARGQRPPKAAAHDEQ
jgi:hypothetical protein